MTTAVRTKDGRRFESISAAARILGVDHATVIYHLDKYGDLSRVGRGNGKQIEFDGVQYPSIRAASRATGKSVDVINRARGYRKPSGAEPVKADCATGGTRSIAAAMIHKTRGPFVEWMAHEIAARMKADVHSVGVLLSGMSEIGLVEKHRVTAISKTACCWKLTEKGAALAATRTEAAFTSRRKIPPYSIGATRSSHV